MQRRSLIKAAALLPFGARVVPLDLECLQPALSIGERFGDDGHTFVDGNHRPDTCLRERRTVVD